MRWAMPADTGTAMDRVALPRMASKTVVAYMHGFSPCEAARRRILSSPGVPPPILTTDRRPRWRAPPPVDFETVVCRLVSSRLAW